MTDKERDELLINMSKNVSVINTDVKTLAKRVGVETDKQADRSKYHI